MVNNAGLCYLQLMKSYYIRYKSPDQGSYKIKTSDMSKMPIRHLNINGFMIVSYIIALNNMHSKLPISFILVFQISRYNRLTDPIYFCEL